MLSIAGVEMVEAMTWYRERSAPAAEGLWLKAQDAKRFMAIFPLAAPLISENVRRFILPGYPYDLIYSVLEEEIIILAVAHHSQKPGYWLERLDQLH